MDLRNGRRRQRCFIKTLINLLQRATQLLFNDLPDLREWDRRGLIQAGLELLNPLMNDPEVRPLKYIQSSLELLNPLMNTFFFLENIHRRCGGGVLVGQTMQC